MTEAISIPSGAFAAMKAGTPFTPPVEGGKEVPVAKKAPVEAKKAPVKKPPQVEHQESGESEQTPTPQRKIYKFKDGEHEYEYDASDEEQVKRDLMRVRASDRRFKESAEMRNQAETFFNLLKDPSKIRQVLTDPRIGVDLKKLAYDYVLEEMEEAKLTPEQRANRERDRRLASYEAKEKANKEAAEKQRYLEQTKALEGHYEQKIMGALKVKGVPNDYETVGKMAEYLRRSISQGYDLAPEELATLIKNDNQKYLSAYADALNDDEFLQFLGEKNAEKLRKGDLKRLKSPQQNPFTDRQPAKSEQSAKSPKKKYGSEWREELIKGFLAKK